MKEIKVTFPNLNEKENLSALALNDLFVRYCKILKTKTRFPLKNRFFLTLAGNYSRLKLHLLANECLHMVDMQYFKNGLFLDMLKSQSHLDKAVEALTKKDAAAARYHSDHYRFFMDMLYIIPWLQEHPAFMKTHEILDFEQILLGHEMFRACILRRAYN